MIKPSLTVAVLAAAISVAYAQTPASSPSPQALGQVQVTGRALAPIEDYLKLPSYASPRLSPNGRYLAVSIPVNGRMNLAVVDLETRKGTALTNVGEFDVLSASWVGNERLVFSLGMLNTPTGPGQFDGGGLFVVSRDGGDARQLAPTLRESRNRQQTYREVDFLRRIPGSSDEILVTGRLRSMDAVDVYRMDLRTGRTTLVSVDRPERTESWLLDDKLVPRIAVSDVKNELVEVVRYRPAADGPWVELWRNEFGKPGLMVPLAMLGDGKTLLVAAHPRRDTMAVYRYDLEKRQLGELVAQHPRYDMGATVNGARTSGAILDPETDRLLGYRVQAEKPETVWIDEKEARTQVVLDRALPSTKNTFVRFPNSSRLLVTSFSDVSPTTWYILDEEKRTLEELFSSRPWLAAKGRLVEMHPFLLKTRDGLEIPSYYFLPNGAKVGDKLPTVVHIHGGPHVRADTWANGFGVQEAELLASRGYAVILPNFRITPGFGAKIFNAGFGAIGRQMSEDHEDAVKWAIDQGIADPNRICISGASYGGYAVMRALAKTPELFKCGIAGAMVSDLEMQLTSTAGDTAYSTGGVEYWKHIIGRDAQGNIPYRAVSPAYQAERIKAPVFIYAGSDDIRTPLEQTNAMVRALERAGNPPRMVMIKKQEGHGFGKVENQVELYTEMLKFIEQSIGPGQIR